ARLQQVLASSTAVIYGNRVRGTSFSPSWMSENITAMMGYDVQAAMDPGWWLAHLHPDDQARVLAEVPALFTQDRLTLEYRFRHAHGDITYFNPGAQRIFGYTADEVSGKPLTTLMPERFRDAHRAGLARYLATGEARVVGRTVELAGRRKDGTEFPLDLSLASWKA